MAGGEVRLSSPSMVAAARIKGDDVGNLQSGEEMPLQVHLASIATVIDF
jgi:hypothetical protein